LFSPEIFSRATIFGRDLAQDQFEKAGPAADYQVTHDPVGRKRLSGGTRYNLFGMNQFQLWAQPAWVNLLILIPLAAAFSFRGRGHLLSVRPLIVIALFAGAFGFVEASVVVYLRAATGLLPGYGESLTEVRRSQEIYHPAISLSQIPQSLLRVEVCREAATMIMLTMVALLAASTRRERWAAFLWAFSFWDLSYYAGLWLTIRWPTSFTDIDVLFLIPVPWIAEVWFPVLVSVMTMLVTVWSCRGEQQP